MQKKYCTECPAQYSQRHTKSVQKWALFLFKEVMTGMGPPLEFPYYYGREAEQYAFYRIPKLLMSDDRFRFESTDAKLLYGLMLDRMSLSLKNGWLDSDNRVYIFFPVEEVMEVLNCKSEKATKLLAELDGKKGIGLIERVRQGQGKPSLVYVKNFAATPPQPLPAPAHL